MSSNWNPEGCREEALHSCCNWFELSTHFLAPFWQDGALLAGKGVFWLFCNDCPCFLEFVEKCRTVTVQCIWTKIVVWTLTCNEMTVSLSYITFRKHCNSSDMFAKFDLHFSSFVFRLKTWSVLQLELELKESNQWHLTWETNMICRCHPWKVPVSGHSNGLRNARTNDHRQCGVYLEFLSFAFAQTMGNYALRRFWCLDQSESATWESSLQRDFKMPQLWKAVCRGPHLF